MAQKHRTIVRDPSFEDDCKKLSNSEPRIDEHLEAAEWAICRRPEVGPEIPGTERRVLRLDKRKGFPALRLFYRIESDDKIIWEALEQVPDDDEPDFF